MKRCYSCFREYGDAYSVCPCCGKVEMKYGKEPIHLVPGTVLGNRYIIGESVGSGGFGIVYRAWDMKFENIVAIKEFFVPRLMTRAQGLKNVIINKKTQVEFEYRRDRFLAEARTMAKFGRHRNIPNVFEFFEENNTAYIVMELLQGMTLSNYIKQLKGKISVDFAVTIAIEIANALKSLHAEGIVHRDVAPDNIFICGGKNIRLKLMDLGAAKLADSTDDVVDIILKPGYSPVEQYDNVKDIGPWTDIYALGATIYAAVTGVKPEESTDRKKEDHVVEPMELNPEISENLNNTIMKAMALETHMRFKNADELIEALNGDRKVIPIHKEKSRRRLKRNLSVIVACLVVIVVGGILGGKYYADREAAKLPSGDIVVWCYEENNTLADGNRTKKDTIVLIADKFMAGCKNVGATVNVTVKSFNDEAEYIEKLEEAYQNGEMPDLFESSILDNEELALYSDSIEKVKERTDYSVTLAFEEKSYLKIPLSVEIPVAYVNVDIYEGDYDYGDCKSTAGSFQEFCEGYTPCYLGTTTEYYTVKENTQGEGKFHLACIFSENDMMCNFTNYWSISGSDGNEEKVRLAEELLGSMVCVADYQRQLNHNTVPVNEKALDEDFSDLSGRYDDFKFE